MFKKATKGHTAKFSYDAQCRNPLYAGKTQNMKFWSLIKIDLYLLNQKVYEF